MHRMTLKAAKLNYRPVECRPLTRSPVIVARLF
jgi:hypothetical protein